MKIDLSRIIVIDVEATCWETKSKMPSEIIEIGCCMFNLHTLDIWSDSIVVRPQQSTVSPFCTKLTGWYPEEIMRGISFQDACDKLRDHGSSNITWASYGYYDQNQFRKECAQKSVKYPFSNRHINIKNLAAIVYNLPNEVGMSEMATKMGITLFGKLHKGVDDAINIAKILSAVLKKIRN